MAGQDFTVSIVGNVTGFDVAPVNNLSNSLKTIPPAANQAASAGQQLSGSLNQVSATTRTTGGSFQATGAMANAFGSNINTARGSAQSMVGANSALGGSFGGVASGGLNANNALTPLNSNLVKTATQSRSTATESIGLGEKIALMGGFMTTTVGHVFGLIEGITGLESAQVTAERTQLRVNITQVAAEKAQDNYNKIVAKFGPESRQAQIALASLENKQEANRLATEKSEIANKKLQESYVSFGLEVINTVGELATMGSTISILLGKMGLKTAAMEADTAVTAVNAAASGEASIALEGEGLAAGTAAGGIEEAEVATAGLNVEMIAIAAPLIAAAALFLLIETNTFGMGDAFRTITPQIGSAIDAIVNGLALMYNGFVRVLEGIIEWGGNTVNTFTSVYNAINTFLDQVVVGFTNLGQDLQNAISRIPNFFIDNLINPVINAWNAFNESLARAWQQTVNAIADAFKPAAESILGALKAIVDAGAAIPSALGDPFRNAQKPINDAIAALKTVGTQGGQTGDQIKTGLTPIPKMADLATTSFQHITTSGLYPLSTAFVDTSGTIKLLDSALITNAGNIKTGAEGFLNYYSQGQNLAGTLKGALAPAIQQVSKFVQDGTQSMFGWLVPTKAASEETNKFGGELGKTSKATKDFATTLDEATAKQLANNAAMLKSISTGQQYAKTLADLGKAYAEAVVKTADLTTKLTDATAIQQRHSTAVQEGINKALEFGIKLQDDATTTATYNAALEQATGFTSKFGGVIPATTANLELMAKAMAGDGEAAQKLMKDFIDATTGMSGAGKALIDDISKTFDDLSKSFKENKAIKEIPKDLRKILSPEAIDFAVLQGEWQASIGKMTEGMALEFTAAGGKFNAAGIGAVQQFVEAFADQKAVRGAPEIKSFLNSFDAVLQQAQAQGGAAGKATIEQFLAKAEAAGGGAGAMAQKIAEQLGIGPEVAALAAKSGTAAGGAFVGTLTSRFGQVPPAVQKNIIDPFTGLPATAQDVATRVGDSFISIGTALEQLPGVMLRIFSDAFVKNLLGPLGIAAQNLAKFVTGVGSALGQIPGALAPLWTKAFVTSLNGPLASSSSAISRWANGILVQVSNMVSNINRILGTIKPPALAGPALPTGPTGPQVPIKMPAPDLTAFEAGLAKMQTDANNTFLAIVNLAKVQLTQLSAAFTTAFNAATLNAGTVMNGLTINVQQNISAMSLAVATFTTAVTTAFNAATLNAGTVMNGLTINVQQNIAAMSLAAATFTTALTTAFNAATLNAGTVMNGLAVNVQQNIANMIAAVNAFPIAMTNDFNTATLNAGTVMNGLAVNVQQNIANMIAATNGFAIAMTNNFNVATKNAGTVMNGLAVNVQTNIQNMISATNAFAIAMTNSFNTGTRNAGIAMNSLASNVATNASNMVSNINRVASAMNSIGSAASSARNQVQALINSINSIPSSKTVNINIIEHRTVVTKIVPGGLSAAGPTTINAAPITTLSAGIASALPRGSAASKRITVEVKEPTIIKINERELIRLINRKILELDLGALA